MGSSLETMDDGQKSWTVLMQKRTASALSRANWVRTAKVETLQALVIYLVSESPLINPEIPMNSVELASTASVTWALLLTLLLCRFPCVVPKYHVVTPSW